MEQKIKFNCEGLELEGLIETGKSSRGAVIAHPHPVYGGNMHNPVVEAISAAYRSKGWRTLRFNFRGTGHSTGSFDNGIGEQRDIDAAIACLAAEGVREFELAGYSFGAWVLACRTQGSGEDHPLRFVAPPVGFMDFGAVHRIQTLRQVIVGTDDAYAPMDQVRSCRSRWNPAADLNVVQGADHFFGNRLDALQKAFEAALAEK